MTTNTTAETNGKGRDFANPDIAAILADPSGSRLDELYEWMDAAKAELGVEDARVARHDALFDAAISGLADVVTISPHAEMERMMAVQLVAAHAATMDCYRRSRTPDVDQRRENLNQASKLSRAFVMLLGALQRHHGKVEKRDLQRVLPSNDACTGLAETPSPAAEQKSEKQPHAQPVAPASVPPAPDSVPAQAASVSAPAVGQAARRAEPAGADAKSEKQPHATATAPAAKAAAELSAEVERLTRVVDDALARRRKSEE